MVWHHESFNFVPARHGEYAFDFERYYIIGMAGKLDNVRGTGLESKNDPREWLSRPLMLININPFTFKSLLFITFYTLITAIKKIDFHPAVIKH